MLTFIESVDSGIFNQRSIAMKERNILPNEKECISQCIIKFWSGSDRQVENRDENYERCLTNCNVCSSA